eukprot:6850420-Prorocentrum_lima.AAC.1
MTSSLVGSEMCIRDSDIVVQDGSRVLPLQHPALEEQMGSQETGSVQDLGGPPRQEDQQPQPEEQPQVASARGSGAEGPSSGYPR